MASLKRFATLGGAAAVNTDPQFNLTTLLLHGDGTNGAQNNTFIDSSSNNFTITRAGNATQGTFTPFSQTGWSVNFDRTNFQNFLYASSADFDMSSVAGDFTIEFFVNLSALPGGNFFHNVVASTSQGGIFFYGASPNIYWRNAADQDLAVSVASGMVVGQWYHLAFVRSGTTYRIYRDGTQITSGTGTPSASANQALFICNNSGYNSGISGYLSNFRFTKSAVYTSSFTPSTSALTTTSQGVTSLNVKLLICQSNRFVDNSVNARTTQLGDGGATNIGIRRAIAFSPFAPTSAYSTSVVGGSGYFDGTGDYLSLADNASLRLGTSAFTIQAWIYRSVTGVAHSIIAKGTATTGYVLQITSTNVLRFTHSSTNVDTTTTIPAGTWTYVAAVRTGTGTNGFQLYINGVSAATATVATDLNQTNTLYVGADRLAATVMNGYISGLRYVVGTAETITIPTAPPSPTGAAICTNFTNAGIIDNTSKNVLETVGNAQINTSVKKFGTGSLLFDGVGDYLKIPSSPITSLGSGSWTIEFWLYRIGSGNQILYDQRNTGTQVAATIYNNTTNTLAFFVNGANRIIDTTTFPSATLTHVAVCKSGSSTRMFVNGTQVGSTYTDTNTYVNNPIFIGAEYTTSSSLNGYIDDLRVSLFARYTANFTPPTAAFADQ